MSGTLLDSSDSTLSPSFAFGSASSRWRHAAPPAADVPLPAQLGRIFGVADIHRLSATEQTQIHRLVGAHWNEVLSLAGERDPAMYREGLLQLGQRLTAENRIEAAVAIFSSLAGSAEAPEGSAGARARQQLDAINGGGSSLFRSEFLLRRLAQESMEPTALFGMGMASAAFRVTRLAALSRLASTPTANLLTRGFGARAVAGLMGFGVEAAVFPMATRLGNVALGRELDWSLNQVGREVAGSFLVLGAMKLAGFGATSAFNRAHGISPATGAATRLTGLSRLTQRVLPQLGMLGGIYGGHLLEEASGLRPHTPGATSFVDSLALLVQFNVAGRLTHGAFGEGFARMERSLDLQTETLARNNTGRRGGFRFGDWAPGLLAAEGPAEGVLPSRSDASSRPVLGPSILMMENNGGRGALTKGGGSSPPPGASTPPPAPTAVNRARPKFEHPLLIVAEEGTKPIHVDVASSDPIAEDAPARIQDALQNLLRGSESNGAFRLNGPVAELLRNYESVAGAFRPSSDLATGLWFQIQPDGLIRQAIAFENNDPRRVVFAHEAQLGYRDPVMPVVHDLVLPGRSGGAFESALYRLAPEGLQEVFPLNYRDSRRAGEQSFEVHPHSTAALKIRLLPMKQQYAVEVRDRRDNLLVSLSAERIMESPAQRLLALFELRRRADADTLRTLAQDEIGDMISRVAALPRDHALRERFLREIGEDPRSVIADLLELMSDLNRPLDQRALLGEAMARREIVGFSRRHQILSYDLLEPIFPPIAGERSGPPPSGVRFVESAPGGELVNRLMVRSWAPSPFDYVRPLEEAVAQLRVLQAAHPESRDNVLQVVVERPETIASDDVFSNHLLDSFRALDTETGDLNLKRVTFVVHRPGDYPGYFTFRRAANEQGVRTGEWVEDRVYRRIHPMLGHFLELSRLDEFNLNPDHAHSDRHNHLFYGTNRASGGIEAGVDSRLFAVSLIPEALVQRNASGQLESIPEVEAAFVRLATQMQNSLEARGKERPIWNRMLLTIQPPVDLKEEEVAAYAESLAIRHRDLLRGLGLEKVVVRGTLRDARTASGYRPILVRISNPTGYQFVPRLDSIVRASVRGENGGAETREVLLRNGRYEDWLADPARVLEAHEWAPADIPIRPATPAEIREQRSRARGATWAYRIPSLVAQVAEDFRVRMGLAQPRPLGSEPPVESTYGSSFVELELDPATTRIDPRTKMLDYNVGELIPAVDGEGESRPSGENQAGVVIGIQSDHLGIAMPVRRMVIMGDLTHESKGSLSANECARINAAIRLAAREKIPVDWYTASSGAEIHEERGVEGLDATASTVREIVRNAHSLGVPINMVVSDYNIGAQSYWNSLATIIHNTGGVLIMTGRGSMALTGPDAWTAAMLRDLHSEDLSRRSKDFYPEGLLTLAGYRTVHGPNGEAMAFAKDIHEASELLLRHHYYSYVHPGSRGIVARRPFGVADPDARDITRSPSGKNGRTVAQEIADIMGGRAGNREAIVEALRDEGSPPFLRWWADAEGLRHQPGGNGLMPQRFGSLIGEMQIGGRPTMVISPPVGPLTPADSEIIARAIWKANGRMPVLIIGSLTGFNADPRSMENRQLFAGASIAEAIVNHNGPVTVVDLGYIVGGSFVVVSKQLNPALRFLALEGAHAQVIGGPSAAKVVFRGAIGRQADRDPRVLAAGEVLTQALERLRADLPGTLDRVLREAPEAVREAVAQANAVALADPKPENRRKLDGELRAALRLLIVDPVRRVVISEIEKARAADFDRVHNIPHAVAVGAVDEEVTPARLRDRIIFHQEEAIREYTDREIARREAEWVAQVDTLLGRPSELALRLMQDSLVRIYGEAGAREMAARLGEGLTAFANSPRGGGSEGSGTPSGGGAPP